jgi:hypothetical protein
MSLCEILILIKTMFGILEGWNDGIMGKKWKYPFK